MREPWASRALIIAAALVSLAFAALMVWYHDRRGYAFPLVLVGYMVVILVIGGLGLMSVFRSGQRRPGRFTVSDGSFQVDPVLSTTLSAIVPMLTASMFTATTVNMWTDLPEDDPFGSVSAAVLTVVVVVIVATSIFFVVTFGWRRVPPVELTPEGVQTRTALSRRMIPWAALAPGGPFRPAPNAKLLGLITVRPDLVVRHGPAAPVGTADRPVLAVDGDVNPWFVADAIRWYVAHPEHRAAIGTQAEHDRLVAELGWAGADQRRG